MKTLLHIDASARKTDNPVPAYNSISKSIAATFIETWRTFNNEDKIIYRDVGDNPPDFISQDWIAAVFTPDNAKTDNQKALLSLSDTLISEVEQADIIVMSSSMYNYGMPATLKAWFDQVIRIHKTFSFDLARGDFPLEPIMSGKILVLITSSGEFGFGIGGIREKMNHLGPHIQTLSHYLGVETFHEINAEYQEFNDDRHRDSVTNAHKAAEGLALKLANF
ncbi:FMN-dependent NADH-azoreductase [Limibacillus halophilus]|uniref:FMN dependent NADH:quinone oxidoreductase n=1 Tax=Limibacillus halophilus TaxID=1579333 RepID=A0A839SYZ6_9PROT|nr:NAD(P)H-dependent oxidoreductase [Limibacillus halophilus]MBB3066816.1 FMN-dependent NADH-azoreductase [Limibacillus halophilus]